MKSLKSAHIINIVVIHLFTHVKMVNLINIKMWFAYMKVSYELFSSVSPYPMCKTQMEINTWWIVRSIVMI